MEMALKDPQFVNKIIKQGNSLCVRIPSSVVKEIRLVEGDDVVIFLHKLDYAKYQNYYEAEFLQSINKLPQLDHLSGIKKKLFTTMTFDLLKKSADKDARIEEKNRKKNALECKKELGEKLFLEYLKFADIVNEHVNILEKDGSIVTRKEFR